MTKFESVSFDSTRNNDKNSNCWKLLNVLYSCFQSNFYVVIVAVT